MNDNNPVLLTIKKLFSSENYIIPIYQRNYAWGESEITQLIHDIADYCGKDQDYYIGTLIVYERITSGGIFFETIDGQQRLTTLSILLSLIKKDYYEDKENNIDLSWYKEPNLNFESRKNSTKTLQSLFNGRKADNDDYSITIKQGYDTIKKKLPVILAEKEKNPTIEDFCNYLFNKVKILRVSVPEDTDLNHYFEIMNSRGEQLEKHEILKAKCISKLPDESDKFVFNTVWEACSNMEKYVQYGFEPGQRAIIFGSGNGNDEKWNMLIDEKDFFSSLKPNDETRNGNKIDVTIEKLLEEGAMGYTAKKQSNNNDVERFNSIIDFPNFLLHVIRIQTKQSISLDDKRLIEVFDLFIEKEGKEFVKKFGYNLLKSKYLYDKYVIKREFAKETDCWSLKRLKWNDKTANYVNTFGSDESDDDINREILMLLSMFHVSFPTQAYKHWLSGVLKFLFEHENATGEEYKKYLENLAAAFLHRRFLSATPDDYYDIIYGDKSVTKDSTFNITHSDDELRKLDNGTAVENFIFNYLDYLLWIDYRKDKKFFKIRSEKPFSDKRVFEYEFSFNNSVEHYYPQNPFDENMKLTGENEKWLHDFGNLCLISVSKNSRLGSLMPNEKKRYYSNMAAAIDSIKQRIMMEYDSWDTCGPNNRNEIKEHGEKMKELLLNKK